MERYYSIEDGKKLVKMENKICNFVSRLEDGEYKVILYNGQTPILADDLGLVEMIIEYLTEETKIELKGNKLVIHTDDEIIELTGRKRMHDGEIFARRYLDECGDDLIIKDNEMQIEMRDDNFKNAKDFYGKCKEIINIRGFFGYDADSSIYKMNWDAFWITYKSGNRELWQRA